MHVVEGVLHALTDHLLHFRVRHIHGGVADFEDAVGVRFRIAGEDVEDAVGVYCKLHADAGLTFRDRLEGDLELAEFPVVARHFPLALEHADEHGRLVRHGVSEHLAGARGDGGVARENDVHEAAEGFNAE